MDQLDMLDRFGRAHLSTEVELAVYLTLDHRRHGFLSAEEVARNTGFPLTDVDPVLRSFSAAGILHEIWLSSTPVYRRHPEIDYLPDDDPDADPAAIDPVCGMLAGDNSPFTERDADGTERRFCSARCRAAFIAFPGLFGPSVAITDGGAG